MTYESLRDMMTPKSKQEIRKSLLSKRGTYDTIDTILRDKSIKRLFTDKEIRNILHSPNLRNIQRLYLLNGHNLDIKKYFNNEHIRRILSLIDTPIHWAHTTFGENLGDIYTDDEIREKLSGLSEDDLSYIIRRYGLEKYYENNENVRDKMTPISKEEVVDKLRITLNKVLKRTIEDCKEEGLTRPIDIGQTAISYTTDEIPIGQVFEEGTDRTGMGTLTLNSYVKEVMEELLVKYFPKWDEKNIKSFWIGFEEEKEIMYFG